MCINFKKKKIPREVAFHPFFFHVKVESGMGPDPNERWTPLQPPLQGPGRIQPQIKITLNANKTSFRV